VEMEKTGDVDTLGGGRGGMVFAGVFAVVDFSQSFCSTFLTIWGDFF